MRILYEDMKETMQNILVKNGFDEKRAEESAKNFADSSLDGVYSHGYQRFPRVIEYIRKGYIDVNAQPEKIAGYGAAERWDGHLGMGNLNAKLAMDRAQEILEETLRDIRESVPAKEGSKVRYPGEGTLQRRKENLEKGIPVKEEIWKKICEI